MGRQAKKQRKEKHGNGPTAVNHKAKLAADDLDGLLSRLAENARKEKHDKHNVPLASQPKPPVQSKPTNKPLLSLKQRREQANARRKAKARKKKKGNLCLEAG